jgi:hypothetical protein
MYARGTGLPQARHRITSDEDEAAALASLSPHETLGIADRGLEIPDHLVDHHKVDLPVLALAGGVAKQTIDAPEGSNGGR